LGTYSRQIVSEVLAANDIVDVIGQHVTLKEAGGGRFTGLCPFHQEKTPSFSVNRDQQFFHCFGCGKGGDVVSFLREFEGLSFVEALRDLAERGGVRLPQQREYNDREEAERDALMRVGKAAARYFENQLNDGLKGSGARQYLKGRALKPETVKRFRLGFAPPSWDDLPNALRSEGFSVSLLEKSGLVRESRRGTHYAFFRNRLMVPIGDTAGHVVAFGGRDLSGEAETPKYINTPENVIYRKGKMLYGLHEARDAIRKQGQVLLVEGYFDLMRCFDTGIENVVAPCGTALTADQAKLLARYAKEAVVLFDGDSAGVRAALRSVGVLTAAGLSVRAVLLPEGQDPDDFVRAEGPDALRGAVADAEDFVSFYVAMNTERLRSIEGRTDVARELFTILLGLDDALRRDEYLAETARALQLDPWNVRREFNRLVREQEDGPATEAEGPPEVKTNHDDVEFVAALLADPALRTALQQQLGSLPLKPGALATVLNALRTDAPAETASQFEDDAARALFGAAANSEPPSADRAGALVAKRLTRLRRDALVAEADRLQEALREAERASDSERVMALLSKRMGIKREIESLGAA
jgi:DNA primase